MATQQVRYRGRNDDGNETTATFKAALNTPWVQKTDVNFRVRFAVQNDTSAISNLDVQLQYQVNSTAGAWTNVAAASAVVRSSASANLLDAANITQQLGVGTGTFIGLTAFDEVDGICGGTSLDVLASGYFECEFSCQLRSAGGIVDGDTIYLRTINSDTGLGWTTYTVIAQMTADFPAKTVSISDALGSYADSLGVTRSNRFTASGDALGSYADNIYRTGTAVAENARGFGVTLGVGTTDVVTSSVTSFATQRSWSIWANRNGDGGNSQGRMFYKSDLLQFINNAGAYHLRIGWSTSAAGLAVWSVAQPATGGWHHFLITYDSGSSSNAPVIYMDGISVTVTEVTAPSGTYNGDSTANSYTIGNSSAGNRGWDGKLAQFAAWHALLGQTEATGLGSAAGGYDGKSPLYYPNNLVEYIALNDDPVTSKVAANPTTTGTAIQTGLIISYPSGAGSNLTVTPSADPLNNWADSLAAKLTYAVQQTDALGSYADSLIAGRPRIGWIDQTTNFLSGVTPIAVNLPADGLGSYADSAAVKYTLAATVSDSLGLYADQAPTNFETLAAAPGADSLGLYADSAPTILEGILNAPAADSLGLYADTGNEFLAFRASLSDDVNQWADQRNVAQGGGLAVALSDSLGLYADQAPVIAEKLSATLSSDSLGLYADQATTFSQAFLSAAPIADSLAAYADSSAQLLTFAAQLSDSLSIYADQAAISLSVNKTVALSDSLGLYADQAPTKQLGLLGTPAADSLGLYADSNKQVLKLAVQLSDTLANYADQVVTAGGRRVGWADSLIATQPPMRLGWVDSVTFTRPISTNRTVNLTSILPIYADSHNERLGLRYGDVIYLVDENGNYIVDENGNKFLISGLIDTLQQSDSLGVTRTALNITPKSASFTDGLAAYGDSLQVSRGIVTLQVSLPDALGSYSDVLLFVQYIGVLVASLTDALGGYTDSNPVFSTAGGLNATQTDALPIYADSIQTKRVGILSVSLTDALGGYSDAAQATTSGALRFAQVDALANYADSIQVGGVTPLFASLSEALGGSYQDALSITFGILRAVSDNLAGYADSTAQLRGLLYSLPAQGLVNYLDSVTTAGVGQLQAALSDNLGKYSDSPPATFANARVQPPADDLAAYADSLAGILELNYFASDHFPLIDRFIDDLDARLGDFNELRYEISDTLNQWADAAAYHRLFFAIRLSGRATDHVALTGKVIEEQIGLNGKLTDSADISGELYIGET